MMDIGMVETGGEWYSSYPGTGRIYRLIDDAQDDNSPDERIMAIIGLGESGDPRAVRTLVTCCRDVDPAIRLHATESLSKLKSCRGVPALVDVLGDRDELPVIRRRAAEALGEIRSYSAVEGLKARLRDGGDDPEILSRVAEVLHMLETGGQRT